MEPVATPRGHAAPPGRRQYRVVQLSDPHLTARVGGRVWGSDVWANLDRTLAHLRTQLEPIDRLVLTGDLANSGSPAAYARLHEVLQPWHHCLRLVPGNHDHRQHLRAAFPWLWPGEAPHLSFHDELAGYRLLGLDSLQQGRTLGRLGEVQLAWLGQQLADRTMPTLLFLHHPPLRVGCWWLDRDLLRDLGPLTALLRTSSVGWVYCGHVHQAHDGRLGAAVVATTPSTAYQYRPHSLLPLPSTRTPALRVLELGGDAGPSQVGSRIVRL